MQKLIMGCAGLAGAGKDTVANAIKAYAEKIGPVAKLSFADPMRAMLTALGVPYKYMVDRELKERPVPGFGLSYRHMAQTLGTEWGRKCCGADFWLQALAVEIEQSKAEIFLIADVRFPNEAQWITDQGGFLVRVHRPGIEPVIAHESEAHVAAMEPWFEFHNNGDLADLQEGAIELLRNAITQRVRSRSGSAAGYNEV